MEPRDVVQAAIDAYHDHDLDRCLSYYAPDVVVRDADGNVVMEGSEVVRARYATSMTENPDIHYDILEPALARRVRRGRGARDRLHKAGFARSAPRGADLSILRRADPRDHDPDLNSDTVNPGSSSPLCQPVGPGVVATRVGPRARRAEFYALPSDG